MIYNVLLYPYRDTITRFLARNGKSVAPILQPLYYEDLAHQKSLAPGTYIFSDIERIGGFKQQAIEMADRLEAAGNTVYNHPGRALGRYDLLTKLYEAKINDFAIHRLEDVRSGARSPRFPAFLRRENDHKGSMSEPFKNMEELEKAAEEFLQSGAPLSELVVIEWCDVLSSDGQYRKYSCFMVGDQFVPGTVVFSSNWITKYPDVLNDANIAEEREYLMADPHPHEALVRAVFEHANLQFGRIDYGLKDGKFQVWEINSNPTIVRRSYPADRLEVLKPTFEGMCNAFRHVESANSAQGKRVALSSHWRRKHGISPSLNTIYPILRLTRRPRRHIVRTFVRIPNRLNWLTQKISGK